MAKKAKEAAPESKRKLYSGVIKCQSTSDIGGLPVEGVVTIPVEAARTEEGVFAVFRSHYANANREDFKFEVLEENG